jgi:hypothetical protein
MNLWVNHNPYNPLAPVTSIFCTKSGSTRTFTQSNPPSFSGDLTRRLRWHGDGWWMGTRHTGDMHMQIDNDRYNKCIYIFFITLLLLFLYF